MKARINVITLPVDDIARAAAFYRDALGLIEPDYTEDADHLAFEMEGDMYMVLIRRQEFSGYVDSTGHTPASRGTSECIMSYFAETREEVDSLLRSVEKAGGTVSGSPREEQWGYAGYFSDPDGHLWEIMYNEKMVG